jgi:hypothetical protein
VLAPVRVHRRQFLIGPEPRFARRDWQARELSAGVVLSACPTLPVEEDGGLVVGIAVRLGPSRESWSGRWVYVDDDLRLELDAGGMLGCFYRRVGDAFWVSSSPGLLAAIEPALMGPAPPLDPDDWTRDWYPPPRSGFAGVNKLLPSQTLDLRTGTIEARPLVPGRSPRPTGEIVDELAELVVALVSEAARVFPDLWVQLSGGMDSRLVLAATHAAGLPVTVYTNDKPGEISKPDRTLPPNLARVIGLDHRFTEPRPPDPRRLGLFDLHTAGHTFETDRRYVACRQWDQIPPSALVLAGNNWEVGRGAYFELFDEAPPAENSDLGVFLKEWLEWVRATPDPTLDWRDRLRIEQNVAGWLSPLEQGVDISGRQRISIATCGDVFRLLLSLPEDVRRSGSHQLELIERLAPELSGFPVNAPESSLRALGRRLRSRRG